MQLRTLGIVSPQAIRNAETITRFEKELKLHLFELEDTIVALICTNPWKTSNRIPLVVVHLSCCTYCSLIFSM